MRKAGRIGVNHVLAGIDLLRHPDARSPENLIVEANRRVLLLHVNDEFGHSLPCRGCLLCGGRGDFALSGLGLRGGRVVFDGSFAKASHGLETRTDPVANRCSISDRLYAPILFERDGMLSLFLVEDCIGEELPRRL